MKKTSRDPTFFQEALVNESILPEYPDIFDSFVELMSLIEVPDGEARYSALREGGVDMQPKAWRHARLGETSSPHVTVLGRAMVTVDQVHQRT